VLTVNRNKETRHVFFDKGYIVGAGSSRSKDRLGAFLLRKNLITEDDLNKLRLKQIDNRRQLGQMLLEMKRLSRRELEQVLQQQAMEIVFDILSWTQGGFVFEERPLKSGEKNINPLSVEPILLESARRRDEWKRIQEDIPDENIVLKRSKSGKPPQEILQQRIYQALEKPRSVAELVDMINESEFKILFELRNMIQAGLIERDEISEKIREAEATQLKFLEDRAVELMEKRAFHDALEYLNDMLEVDPESQRARELMEKARRELVIDARRMISSDKIIPRIRRSFSSISPDMMTMSPQEGFVFSRLDGHTNIKMLQYLTQMPMDELYVILHKFSRMGLIYFSKRNPVKSG
jgi:hypothetical protein